MWEVWGSIPSPVESDAVSSMARHRCDVSSKLCYLDSKPWRWIPQLVTRFGVIRRVACNEDLIFDLTRRNEIYIFGNENDVITVISVFDDLL